MMMEPMGSMGMMVVMSLLSLAVIAAIVVGVVFLVRAASRRAATSAAAVLDERFARGDIDRTEYQTRREALRQHPNPT